MINSGREWDWMNKNKINNIKELKGIANMKKYILKMWILAIVLLPLCQRRQVEKITLSNDIIQHRHKNMLLLLNT